MNEFSSVFSFFIFKLITSLCNKKTVFSCSASDRQSVNSFGIFTSGIDNSLRSRLQLHWLIAKAHLEWLASYFLSFSKSAYVLTLINAGEFALDPCRPHSPLDRVASVRVR